MRGRFINDVLLPSVAHNGAHLCATLGRRTSFINLPCYCILFVEKFVLHFGNEYRLYIVCRAFSFTKIRISFIFNETIIVDFHGFVFRWNSKIDPFLMLIFLFTFFLVDKSYSSTLANVFSFVIGRNDGLF